MWKYTPEWTDADIQNFVAGCVRNQVDPLHVMPCMLNESGAYPTTRNPGGVNPSPEALKHPAAAVGLIQFTHASLGAGVDLDAFRQKSVAEQLPFVERYFAPYRGALTSVELVYCSMFEPAWIAKHPTSTTVICGSRAGDPYPKFYAPNKSLDVDGKGYIILDDLRIRAMSRAHGPRWQEFVDRIRAAQQGRPTDPLLVPDTLDAGGSGATDDDPDDAA